LHERVEGRRPAAWSHAPFIQADRTHVLLAAEHEFEFLLALRLKPPRRQHGSHEDRHHGQRNQERRHRKATLGVLTP
jgi:hypothetical protein